MGVLYHRRSPIDHLQHCRSTLRSGGTLVLETLVIEGERGHMLLPDNRYAKMRNVWFIPSLLELEHWVRRCGFKDIQVSEPVWTSTEEQRQTDWMTFESLSDFLIPMTTPKQLKDTQHRYAPSSLLQHHSSIF